MRLILAGGRHFDDSRMVSDALSALNRIRPFAVLIHGGCPGIGIPAEAWGRRHGIHIVRYPPPRAGSRVDNERRDEFMISDGRPDLLLAFPGGRRTQRLCSLAAQAGVERIEAAMLVAQAAAEAITIPA